MTETRQKTVWITRTLPSAAAAAEAVQRAGFQCVTAPLLTVETLAMPELSADNLALIFTSQNGVRAFCENETRRDCAVVTVGDATAQLARSVGFKNVQSAGGTSDDIAPLIARINNTAAHYVHVSGNHVRGRVSQDLQSMGLSAERRIYYRSAPVQAMPDIDVAKVDIAAFFSPLAAQTFAAIGTKTETLNAVSISAATDEALGALNFKSRRIATAPTLEALIASLALAV